MSSVRQRSEGCHILVVEDDSDLRDTLREVLEAAGHSVAVAQDGLDALSQLRQETGRRPDLILLDLQMPNMNGIEFREQQLQTAALVDIPVVVLTADPQGEAKIAALRTSGFLRKPLKLPSLLKLIPQIVERSRSRSEDP